MNKPLGCLTRSGLLAALLVLVLLAGTGLVWGGLPFNPGPLNAQGGVEPLGGVESHAETGGRCSACHVAFWSNETMSDRCLLCHVEIAAQLRDPDSLHAVMTSSSETEPCYQCHPEHQGSDGPLTKIDSGIFPHQATGYLLEGHQQMADGAAFACTDCHGEAYTNFDLARCSNCHRDLDGAAMDEHDRAFGPRCLACHDGLDTYGAGFDHAQTNFPLEGRHAPLACAECHRKAGTIADLENTSHDCLACHTTDDAHDGAFGLDCAECHTTEGWEQATFDHNQSTFPLTGAHLETACAQCHLNGIYRGTPHDCLACHTTDDAHDGTFGLDCAECHTTEGWEQATFDHNQSTFPLTGAHLETACAQCHLNGIYRGTPHDCLACHTTDDAHDGTFGLDCAECHTTEGWEQATFDHNQSAFPLTGAHLETACAQCHLNGVYQGTPQDCAACHEDPAFHLGLLGDDCVTCHDTSGWSPARYDRAHTFPINHGEQGTSPCQTCHPENLSAYTCYSCHEHNQVETEREHREEGINDFQDCMRCHPTGEEEEREDD